MQARPLGRADSPGILRSATSQQRPCGRRLHHECLTDHSLTRGASWASEPRAMSPRAGTRSGVPTMTAPDRPAMLVSSLSGLGPRPLGVAIAALTMAAVLVAGLVMNLNDPLAQQ